MWDANTFRKQTRCCSEMFLVEEETFATHLVITCATKEQRNETKILDVTRTLSLLCLCALLSYLVLTEEKVVVSFLLFSPLGLDKYTFFPSTSRSFHTRFFPPHFSLVFSLPPVLYLATTHRAIVLGQWTETDGELTGMRGGGWPDHYPVRK